MIVVGVRGVAQERGLVSEVGEARPVVVVGAREIAQEREVDSEVGIA